MHAYAHPRQLFDLDCRILKMYPFGERDHQKSGTETCTNLALVGLLIFWIHRKQTESLLLPWSAFRTCINSERGVITNPAGRRVQILLLLDFSSFVLTNVYALIRPDFNTCSLSVCARIRTPTSAVRSQLSYSQNVSIQ